MTPMTRKLLLHVQSRQPLAYNSKLGGVTNQQIGHLLDRGWLSASGPVGDQQVSLTDEGARRVASR